MTTIDLNTGNVNHIDIQNTDANDINVPPSLSDVAMTVLNDMSFIVFGNLFSLKEEKNLIPFQ